MSTYLDLDDAAGQVAGDKAREELDALRAENELMRAKLAAIGRLIPTDYDDREQLLGALFRIRRSSLAELQEEEPCN